MTKIPSFIKFSRQNISQMGQCLKLKHLRAPLHGKASLMQEESSNKVQDGEWEMDHKSGFMTQTGCQEKPKAEYNHHQSFLAL